MQLRSFAKAILVSSALFSQASLADIQQAELPKVRALQYHNATLISAGLPEAEEIPLLADAGVEVVINLIPTDAQQQIVNEEEVVVEAGMAFHRIEVDWQNPTLENYDQFESLMQEYQGKSVLVHCQLNWRASAFVYLHQRAMGNDDLSIMAPWGDLQQSFAKYPQWAELVEQVKQRQ